MKISTLPAVAVCIPTTLNKGNLRSLNISRVDLKVTIKYVFQAKLAKYLVEYKK